jgi:hypothetical protein
LSPLQQADETLLGGISGGASLTSSSGTPEQQADAVLVDLLGGDSASAISSDVSAGEAPAETVDAALVTSLASQITAEGSQASTAYQLLSASATHALST